MAYEPKGPVKKTGAVPSKKGKPAIIAAEQVAVPWYFQKRNIVLFISGLIILIVIAFKIREPSKTVREIQKQAPQPAQVSKKEEISKEVKLPQIISVKLTPSSPVKGDAITANVETRDNMPITYEWAVNGEVVSETGNTLSAGFKRGDKVSLTVTSQNEKEKAASLTVDTHIFNGAPVITSTIQEAKFNNGFTYQVKAKDPDNDRLRYSLKAAPEGMTIDPETGLIKWTVPTGLKGKVYVGISVTDVAGGEAKQIFNLQFNQ